MKVTRKAGKIDAMRQAVAGLTGAEAKVGWFESARAETGKPIAGIAVVQEFGSPARGIPPRSFMRTTVDEKRTEWAKFSGDVARQVMLGKMPPDSLAEALGSLAEGHVRAKIGKISAPPLKPATVAARKRRLADGGKGAKASIAKPLVDTGHMLDSLTSQVTKK